MCFLFFEYLPPGDDFDTVTIPDVVFASKAKALAILEKLISGNLDIPKGRKKDIAERYFNLLCQDDFATALTLVSKLHADPNQLVNDRLQWSALIKYGIRQFPSDIVDILSKHIPPDNPDVLKMAVSIERGAATSAALYGDESTYTSVTKLIDDRTNQIKFDRIYGDTLAFSDDGQRKMLELISSNPKGSIINPLSEGMSRWIAKDPNAALSALNSTNNQEIIDLTITKSWESISNWDNESARAWTNKISDERIRNEILGKLGQ